MEIILLNTPEGEVSCTSIVDAEKKSIGCTENVRVKCTNEEEVILFDFDPNKVGFSTALCRTRAQIVERKKEFLEAV